MHNDINTQQEAAAYHEAGHGVIAVHYGAKINHEGIRIESDCYTGIRWESPVQQISGKIPVNVAGWLSECKWYGRNGQQRYSDDDIVELLNEYRQHGYFLDEIEDEPLDDFESTIKHIADLGADDETALAWFRAVESDVIKTLEKPTIWAAIETLAKELLTKKSISGDDANKIINTALTV